jgi:dipeptidyl aminopeptidase/acylaminoacyl peptidase
MARYYLLLLVSLLLVSLFLAAPAVRSQTAAFPTNEQLRQCKRMAAARLSPDGQLALIEVTDSTADGGKSHIWVTGTHGEPPRQLTYSAEADKQGEHDAAWMPDGQSILFLAKREEHKSLYRLPMNGGEAHPFSLKIKPEVDESRLPDSLPIKDEKAVAAKAEEVVLDVNRYSVAPDGATIAIIARDPETPGEKAQKEAKADANWVDRNPHGARLYLLNAASGKLTPTAVVPDVKNVAWSSDSRELLALSEGMNNAGDLGPARTSWLIAPGDADHPTQLTDLPPTIEDAAFVPGHNAIYYLAQAKQDTPPGYVDLYFFDLDHKTTRNLSDGFQGSLQGRTPIPLGDGSVVLLAQLGFNGKVARYAAAGGPAELLSWDPADISEVDSNARRSGWLLLGSGGGSPPQLYYAADLKSSLQPLKTPPLFPEHLRSVAPKRVQWKSDSFTIEGRLYLPPEAATTRVPLIVEVHGGPLGAYSDAHEPWIDFLLGHGWAVLRANPRGSTGYGAAFAAANKNDLGGGDERDIMAGVDYVLRTESIDGNRMALMGYSYGGEMAAFVEGRTDRFKAIISGAPVIDQHSEYGTEDSSWYDRWYFGKPWEHPEDAWRQSPLASAGKAKTPFLLLQGEGDNTDPLGQSKEMYRALRQAGVPVELVTYPRDDHGPLARAIFGYPVPEPWHGYDARRRIVAFIEKGFAAAPK